MATEIYVFHPGSGVNRALDGALSTQQDGTNVGYLQQRFTDGVHKRSYFHGAVVPKNASALEDVTVKVVFKQLSAGAGDIYVNVGYNGFFPPTDRDSPLTLLTPVAIAMPGTVGQEVDQTFTIPAGALSPSDELIFCIERLGGDLVNDSFVGDVSLVRFDVEIPIENIILKDEGIVQTRSVDEMNFTGAGVTATAIGGVVTVDIPGGGGGGVGGNNLVYRPGGVAGGNVFITWDTLYTAYQGIEGNVNIEIDTSLGVASVAGASAPYDMSRMYLQGADLSSGTIHTLNVEDTLSGLPSVVGNGIILNNSFGAIRYTTAVTGERMVVEELAVVNASSGFPLFKIDDGHDFFMNLHGQLGFDTGGVIQLGVNSTLSALTYGSAFTTAAGGSGGVATVDASGTANFTSYNASETIADQSAFGGFTGTYNRFLASNSLYQSYDNTISGLSSVNVKEAIDELAAGGGGSLWFDATAFIRPLGGAGKEVVIGDTVGPVGNEKLRVQSDSGNPAVRSEGDLIIADPSAGYTGVAGTWNGPHFIMGDYHFWVDATGVLRMKNGAPTGDLEGEEVGAQGG